MVSAKLAVGCEVSLVVVWRLFVFGSLKPPPNKFSKKSLPSRNDILKYEDLLPSLEVMQWMSFMISLNIAINQDLSRPKVEYVLNGDTLQITLLNKSFLIESNIEKLESPEDLNIKI